MVICEHFIYTSAEIDGISGYQVIAQSSGITPKILTSLENYLYPIGSELSKFDSSISLMILKEHVAFTRVRNIGIGPDGRHDTLYSHTIVMKKKDFQKFKNDSRIFFKKYQEITNPSHLTPIIIESKNLEPDFTGINEMGIILFEYFIHSIFSQKKIALIDFNSEKLIPSLLSLIPPSLRLISFSSLIADYDRQPKYKLIQIRNEDLSQSTITKIRVDKIPNIKKTRNKLYENCIDYIINIIKNKEKIKLQNVFTRFEDIVGTIEEKTIFSVSSLRLESKSMQIAPDEIKMLEVFFKDHKLEHNSICLQSIASFLNSYSDTTY